MRCKAARDLETIADPAQLRQHLLTVLGIDRAVDLHVEIVLPGMLFHGAAAKCRHVVSVSADDADGVGQGACLMLDGEQ